MAGGGVRGSHTHGETDDFGNTIVGDSVHVHDLHATILHLLGLDHTRLTYRHAGRDYRLGGEENSRVRYMIISPSLVPRP